MKHLYVIGPVTGKPNENRQAFHEARRNLKAFGYYAQIPHDYISAGSPWNKAMAISLDILTECGDEPGVPLFDGVALLTGWDDSKGACLEKQVAEAIGLTVKTVDEWIEAANA